MSCAVVFQPLTLTRIAARPCQTVGPHQQVPSSCTAAMTALVRVSSPKSTTTWLSTTSLATVYPAAHIPSANRRASAQVRSTRASTPSRPRVASTAHISAPLARWDDCGVTCMGSLGWGGGVGAGLGGGGGGGASLGGGGGVGASSVASSGR